MLRHRPCLVFAGIFAIIPWLLMAVYLPLTHGAPFPVVALWRVLYLVVDVFAPLYYLVQMVRGPLEIAADHTSPTYQFWSWTVFSLANFAFWYLVFRVVGTVLRHIKAAPATSGTGDEQR